jgi:enoyl-CoA hydratase/carnithine racemase
VASDLCLTGRVIGPEEALSLGVVSRISAGREALDEVANAPASATAEVKRRLLLHCADESPRGLLAEEERSLRAALLGERSSS